ncbi:MAG: S9 family peptidase, partial [Planctomycetota bacterium]|nr:S9 family peptidase [Planctomycetota bacterium]
MRFEFRFVVRVSLAIGACVSFVGAGLAHGEEAYRRPPEEIVKILEAAPPPAVSTSPDRTRLLLVERESMPSIADMAEPMLRLAGRRISPVTNAWHGPRSFVGITIKEIEGGREIEVALPEDADVGYPQWSPDATKFMFTLTRDDGVELWVADAKTGSARAVTGRNVNPLGVSPSWMPDSQQILVGLVPQGRGEAPVPPNVPTGPVIQENMGGKPAPVRTYQDLLSSPHDEALFDHYFTSQLAMVNASGGRATNVGKAAVYLEADPAPTGSFLLVERVEKPYSYLVPMWSFPRSVEVWRPDGTMVKQIAKLPLAERVPIGGVITGPRSHQWRDTEGTAEILWAEALDEGDPNLEASQRDKVLALRAPFTGEAREVLRTEDRFVGVGWMSNGQGLAREYDRDERWLRTWVVDWDSNASPRLMNERSVRDRYGDPGSPVTTLNKAGRSVVMVEDGSIFLAGDGASPEGERPFLDRMSLESFETERLWRSTGACYERVSDVIDPAKGLVLTRYETSSEPPNYFLRDLKKDERRALTSFE